MDQENCHLLHILMNRFQSLDHKKFAPKDALTELFFLLQKIAASNTKNPITVGYLLQAINHTHVDHKRSETGRPQCGLCSSYGWISRRCLHRESPHYEPMDPSTEPHRLIPRCRFFVSKRSNAPMTPEQDVKNKETHPAERVMRALRLLESSDPAAAAILIEHHIEGSSLRAICKKTGCHRRRLSQELKKAQEQLGYILEDIA